MSKFIPYKIKCPNKDVHSFCDGYFERKPKQWSGYCKSCLEKMRGKRK